MTTRSKPWAEGPRRTLIRVAELLRRGTREDDRIAYYEINSVIQECILEYLKIVDIRSAKGRFQTKDLLQARANFPSLLNMLQNISPSILDDEIITNILWYHKSRNILKGGEGPFCIDQEYAADFFGLACVVFERLFDEPLVSRAPIQLPATGVMQRNPMSANRSSTRIGLAAVRKPIRLLVAHVVFIAQSEGYRGNNFFEAMAYLDRRHRLSQDAFDAVAEIREKWESALLREGFDDQKSVDELGSMIAHALQYFPVMPRFEYQRQVS
jgi:hypothetical protein